MRHGQGRDQQKSRCYASENAIADAHATMIGEMPEVRAYVERVLGAAWFRKRYGRREITIGHGAGHRRAVAYGKRHIELPRWARTDLIILHEIAHCVTPNDPGHGPLWARTFLEFVRHYVGREAYLALRASMKAHRVSYTVRSHATRTAARAAGASLASRQTPAERARNLAKARVALIRGRIEKLEARYGGQADIAQKLEVERARLTAALEILSVCERVLEPPARIRLDTEAIEFLIDSTADARHSIETMLERPLPEGSDGTCAIRLALWRAGEALDAAFALIRAEREATS